MSNKNYKRIIKAVYNNETIRVYQAYNKEIAEGAVKNQRFVHPWLTTRTTWIKPSLCWMMYRAGYGYKDKNQERILAIDIKIEAFEWILDTYYSDSKQERDQNDLKAHPKNSLVIQWDPERSIKIGKLENGELRSIQIGIKPFLTQNFNNEWITEINDITDVVHQIKREIDNGDIEKAISLLPIEKVYTPKNIKF
ncbi:hypothetical protein RB653_004375 [Dictyostelium firmibasis]|uniref:DUF4291 domain-containing protein n=1 Tax=Dictyostelium firmibasis TaxID=79012 RepID=A0AAN7TZD7_9MYCE